MVEELWYNLFGIFRESISQEVGPPQSCLTDSVEKEEEEEEEFIRNPVVEEELECP